MSIPQYSVITQKKIALALRNDLINRMRDVFAPENEEFTSMEKLYISFWFGQCNNIQKYINWLDPDFPAFDSTNILDAHVLGLGMIENALDFYIRHESLKSGTGGELVTIQDFRDGIHSGLYDDNEGHGCFSDGKEKWTRHIVEVVDFEDY